MALSLRAFKRHGAKVNATEAPRIRSQQGFAESFSYIPELSLANWKITKDREIFMGLKSR